MAAVSVTDAAAARRVVRHLVRSGNRRWHMVDERPSRRSGIVTSLMASGIEVTIDDAARRYRTDRQARAACLAAVVADFAALGRETRLVIEQDKTLVRFDQQCLIEASRANGPRGW